MVKYFIFYVTLALTIIVNNCYSQNNDSITIVSISIAEGKPVYIGNLKDFINNHINYPHEAKKDSTSGKVFVSFWVDTTGKTINHKIIRGIREDLNQEALRVSKLISFDKPAMQNGNPVKVRLVVPVEFKMKNSNND